MKIENIKQLQRLIKLCRTMGVEAIEVDNVKMNLGPTPIIYKKAASTKSQLKESTPNYAPGGITEDTRIPTDGLTDEQMLFWSAEGATPPIEPQ